MSDITYDTIIQVLLEELPELQERYEEYRNVVEGLPHVVYSDVLGPYLRDALADPEIHGDFLARAFALLERLESHADTDIENVGAVSVIERLLGDPNLSVAVSVHGGVCGPTTIISRI